MEDNISQKTLHEVIYGKSFLIQSKQRFDNLLADLQSLVAKARKEYDDYINNPRMRGHDIELSDFSQALQDEFFAWHKKYENLLTQAVALNLIDEEFIEHYKSYSQADWDGDPTWNKVKNFYLQRDAAVSEVDSLNATIQSLDQDKQKRDYVYKVMVGLFALTVVIPIIVLIIYAIDTQLTSGKISEKNSEKTDTKNRKQSLENDVRCSTVGELKGSLCYQMNQLSQPFFAILKAEAGKAKAEEIEENPPESPRISPSSSSESSE